MRRKRSGAAFSALLLAKACLCLVLLSSILAFAAALAFAKALSLAHSSKGEGPIMPFEKTAAASCGADDRSRGGAHPEEEERSLRLCSLSRSYSGDFLHTTVKWMVRGSTVQRALGFWPREVSGRAWADDYIRCMYLITTGLLLPSSPPRDESFLRIPTRMARDQDVMRVGNIAAPLVDVDGRGDSSSRGRASVFSRLSDFFLENSVAEQWLRAPMQLCFYSALRRLSTHNEESNGTFADDLCNPGLNTWEAAMSGTPFERKSDWIAAFYRRSGRSTQRGAAQLGSLETYHIKSDFWDDELEATIAFGLFGSHRLEVGPWTFVDLPGAEQLNLPFRIALNLFAALEVREHFGKYGADLYFDDGGSPVLIETPGGLKVLRGDRDWQYWKFVWRSTLLAVVTLVDHLHLTHFRTANTLARVSRVTLAKRSPLRRVTSIFTFGSIGVNANALHLLLGRNHILHRATAFKDFERLSSVVSSRDTRILADVTEIPAIKALANATEFARLPPLLQSTPFYSDGVLVFAAIQKMVHRFVHVAFDLAICPGGQLVEEVERLRTAVMKETQDAQYALSGSSLEYLTEEEPCTSEEFKQTLLARLTAYFFIVSAWHLHVGSVAQYYSDPELVAPSWKQGEAYGRPRQQLAMTVIYASTLTRQPLLKADFTHLFEAMAPDLSKEFKEVWHDFQKDLAAIGKIIDERNEKRKVGYFEMHPAFLEASVSK